MEITSIIVLAGLGVSVVVAMKLFYNAFKRASAEYDKKLADDYRKAVEKHQLSEEGTLYEGTPTFLRERVKEIEKSKRSVGDFLSVPSQLVDPNLNLFGLDISSDNSQDFSATIHYDGAGHGGSFGGGGASGSWDSDSSSSDSGGSDSSSSD